MNILAMAHVYKLQTVIKFTGTVKWQLR